MHPVQNNPPNIKILLFVMAPACEYPILHAGRSNSPCPPSLGEENLDGKTLKFPHPDSGSCSKCQLSKRTHATLAW